jgi:hypothetical protein
MVGPSASRKQRSPGWRAIYDKFQRAAHFWSLSAYSLQTTFFMAFGRIFDKRSDSFSVQKLVEATIANPALFSKAALRERKRKSANMTGSDPRWLVDYLNKAWDVKSLNSQIEEFVRKSP